MPFCLIRVERRMCDVCALGIKMGAVNFAELEDLHWMAAIFKKSPILWRNALIRFTLNFCKLNSSHLVRRTQHATNNMYSD